MAEEKKEEKIILEREYIVPLRRKFLKTPKYKRVPKAVKALKKFIARHMQIRDNDAGKIKIDKYLNEELWFRGIQKPPYKIKVKCKKLDSGIVKVELAEIPEAVKWKIEKEKKIREKIGKKAEEKKEKAKEGIEEKVEEKEKAEEVKKEKPEEKIEKKEEKEKEKATIEAGLKQQEMKAKEIKHEVKISRQPKHQIRKALQK